jgi:hypothetical protein
MKIIPDELKSDIEDAPTAGMLGNLSPAIVGKDVLFTLAVTGHSGGMSIAYQALRGLKPSPFKVLVRQTW